MPKEQIRKRGRRKPKVEEALPPPPLPPPSAEIHIESNEPARAGPSSGIHPSRIALLKGHHTPLVAAPATAQDPEIDTEEGGEAQWERGPRADSDFPFGVLDPDVKAYFRNVEDQIKDWEGTSTVGEDREGTVHSFHWSPRLCIDASCIQLLRLRSSTLPPIRALRTKRFRTPSLYRPGYLGSARTTPSFHGRLGEAGHW